MLAVGLVAAVFSSAIAVVYVKHESRVLFVELQRRHRDRDALQVEWSRLELEYGAWATHDRIEDVAGSRLGLHPPGPSDLVLVTR